MPTPPRIFYKIPGSLQNQRGKYPVQAESYRHEREHLWPACRAGNKNYRARTDTLGGQGRYHVVTSAGEIGQPGLR